MWKLEPFLHISSIFFFNDTATTEIYTLSLHDALPISMKWVTRERPKIDRIACPWLIARSEEHTSELQSRLHLVCRLLLEKKKKAPVFVLCDARNNYHDISESSTDWF